MTKTFDQLEATAQATQRRLKAAMQAATDAGARRTKSVPTGSTTMTVDCSTNTTKPCPHSALTAKCGSGRKPLH